MAQKTIVELVDDLDGGVADVTTQFGLDGVDFEIDLSTANATRLRHLLDEFTGAARRLKRDGTTAKPRGTKTQLASNAGSREQSKAIRQWARDNTDLDVPDRGRLPKDIVQAYEKAHATSPTQRGLTVAAAARIDEEPLTEFSDAVSVPVYAGFSNA